jgi:ABC-2 type transport system ATP-binding protein
MPPVIVAHQLSKRYGTRLAVDRVSFAVEAGEVMGLLGPNGSGKTTILRLLTGYLRPSSGTACVAGFDVAHEGLRARQHVGYVPEDVPLYTHMRVEEFLAFMGRLKGLSGQALQEGIAVVCARLALVSVQRTVIGKLSRGYRQRVAIAQALLNNPPLLILDEPTNGLDPHQIIEIRELIRALACTQTILVTSHILGEIEKVANRVAILLDGRLLAVHTLGSSPEAPCLRLTIRGWPRDQVQACLQAVPGVERVTVEGMVPGEVADYVVQVSGLDLAETLAVALVASGFGVLAMQAARLDLETVFLQLTRPEVSA